MMSFVFVFLTISFLTTLSSSATTSFVFGGCSQQKYLPGSPYESKVNSLLTSVIKLTMFSTCNNFTFPDSSSTGVSQLGTLCLDSCSGALQCLDSCEGSFEKYDNAMFLGVEDKTVVVKKCEPSIGFDSDSLTNKGTYRPYGVSDWCSVSGI